jgi:probable F420-dependent oxidoreductase
MELSLSLPAPGLSFRQQVEYARRAEDAGYTTAWVAETAGPDAFVLAAAVAGGTGLRLGTGVVPVYTRTPMALAMAASSVAQITGDRFTLGLGSSSHNIVEGWGGTPFVKPLTRVRETVEVLRQALTGQKVMYEGETLRMSNFRLGFAPKQPLPIYVGALNAKMLRLAGAVGDGCWVNMLGEEKVPQIRAEYEAGAREAGRDPGPIVCRMQTVVTDQPEAAYGMVKGAMAGYVATPVYNKFFTWIGFEDEARGVREAFGRGDRAGTAEAMTDDLAKQIVTAGTPEEIAERFVAYGENGIDDACMQPLVPSADAAYATMEQVAAAFHKLQG